MRRARSRCTHCNVCVAEMDVGGVRCVLDDRGPGVTLLGRAFRPFFLLAGLQASVAVLAWLAIYAGVLPEPGWLAYTPSLWHAHEMVFGFVVAAASGFLLTAAPTWTQSRPVTGAGLGALAALWLAGRVAMVFAGVVPRRVGRGRSTSRSCRRSRS